MKLIIATSLKEYSSAAASIFSESGIHIYSVTKTIGHKEGSVQVSTDSWFGMSEPLFDSVFLFAFTEDDHAHTALKLVQEYNDLHKTAFPLRAFILPVENSSY
jgi:hypothetical protein